MNPIPSVDVIILSWDRMEETLCAIDSALSQQGIHLRVIVVDQGSAVAGLMRLRAHCARHPQVTLVVNQTNLGVPGGRNQATLQGTAEFVVALDNDAEFQDEHQLAKAAALMLAEPELGALAFRILRFGSDEDDLTSWSYHQSAAQAAETSFYTDRFVGAGHMLRRSAFEQVGGYDASLFFLHEEVDLAKRLINAGYRIKYSPDVVIGHKVSAQHRVAWTGGRWAFDVRNKTYLHIKFRTFLPTAIFHTALMVWRGCRSGLYAATFKGLWQGLMMTGLAIRAWKTQPAVKPTASSKAYMDACSPTRGMTLWQRVRMRLRHATPVPIAPKG